MNRSYIRAKESEMSVKQRQLVAASLRNSMIKEKEDDLALFLEMRKRDKEREIERDRDSLLHLLNPNSDDFDAPLGIH